MKTMTHRRAETWVGSRVCVGELVTRRCSARHLPNFRFIDLLRGSPAPSVSFLTLSVSQLLLPNRRGIACMGSTDGLCRGDGAWASSGGGGVKDWPPNFGAPRR